MALCPSARTFSHGCSTAENLKSFRGLEAGAPAAITPDTKAVKLIAGECCRSRPQMRILVDLEAVDGRKGIDSLIQLCREKLLADPFSRYLFVFAAAEPRRFVPCCMTVRVLVGAEAAFQRTICVVAVQRRAGACD